jgi:hypothetical protein
VSLELESDDPAAGSGSVLSDGSPGSVGSDGVEGSLSELVDGSV